MPMENFIVSARKYRPATFETVVGQQHITGTLKNAIKNNQLAQAFLFCGPRGVGKTTCARILAKTINCTNLTPEVEACGTCESCQSFQTGHSFNFHELDAASNNSVEDIRSLIEQVRIPPQAGKYKIYIIDEVHMLSTSAFNAFLKTLEEPPSYAIFILATTEKHKILPTILSRCQIFDFNRIQVEDISQHLAKIATRENIATDNDALHLIAQKADGGLRDALSIFDQIVSYTNRNVSYKAVLENLNILDYDYFFRLTDILYDGDLSNALLVFNEILNNGFDGNNFINGLASHFRNLLVAKDAQTVSLLEVSETIKQKYLLQAQKVNLSFLLTALNLANQCDLVYKSSKNQRLQVELSLIKICHIPSAIQLANTATDASQDKKKTLVESPTQSVKQSEKSVAQVVSQPKEVTGNVVPIPATQPTAVSNSASAVATKTAQAPAAAIKLPNTGSIKINPSSKSSSLIPSLNNLEKTEEELANEGPKYVSGSDRQAFTISQVLDLWAQYTQKAKNENKIHLYTLLSSYPPEVDGHIITVSIENGALEATLSEEKIDLLNFLRPALKNFDTDLLVKRVAAKETKRLYTNKDKYAHMVEKNPQLEEFRRRFNLDINP